MRIPAWGMTRGYVMNFIHFLSLQDSAISTLKLLNDNRCIISSKIPMGAFVSRAFVDASKKLDEYLRIARGPEVPASGGDREIFARIKKDLNLSGDSTFQSVFRAYAKKVEKMDEDELEREMLDINGIYPSPSIFKPELYEYTRAPFQVDQYASDQTSYDLQKHTLGGFLIRVAGYVYSRAGRVTVKGSGGKFHNLTALVLPIDVGFVTRYDFDSIIESLRKKQIPGFNPVEALVVWLALALPKDAPEILIAGMEDPAGQSPAKINSLASVPLISFRERAKRFLEGINQKENQKSWLMKSLADAVRRDDSDSKLILKLLFRALQNDILAVEELSLRVSRIVMDDAFKSERKNKDYVRFCNSLLRNALPLLRYS
jgi:hypothetical protein